MTTVIRRTMSGDEADIMRRIRLEADAWGGHFAPQARSSDNPQARLGRLRLPTQAGLRYGWVEGLVSKEKANGSDELSAARAVQIRFETETSELHVQKAAVGVLLLAAAGAVTVVLAPLVPVLFALLPVGVMLSLAGWLFVVARLRNSGPEEFFDAVAENDPSANSTNSPRLE